jgi:hypothetical protein
MTTNTTADAVKKIEAALGLARCSETNVTGYVVEQIGDTFRIYDDHCSKSFRSLNKALAYARECAVEAVEALAN